MCRMFFLVVILCPVLWKFSGWLVCEKEKNRCGSLCKDRGHGNNTTYSVTLVVEFEAMVTIRRILVVEFNSLSLLLKSFCWCCSPGCIHINIMCY